MKDRLSSRLRAALEPRRTVYAPGRRGQADTLIASYNVHKCVGTYKRFPPDRTAAVIGERRE